MKQDDITAHLLLELQAAQLAIAAQHSSLDPSQRAQALQWLEKLASSTADTAQAAHLARGWLLPGPEDGGS